MKNNSSGVVLIITALIMAVWLGVGVLAERISNSYDDVYQTDLSGLDVGK